MSLTVKGEGWRCSVSVIDALDGRWSALERVRGRYVRNWRFCVISRGLDCLVTMPVSRSSSAYLKCRFTYDSYLIGVRVVP